MKAMVLDRPGTPLRAAELARPRAWPRAGARRGRAPAASAAPTCTSSTASCPTRSCRSSSATRSSGESSRGGERFDHGDRVGIPWLGWTDGECRYCLERPREPLRPRPLHRLHARRRLRRAGRRGRALLRSDPRRATATSEAAPLLCAGLIGYRALRMAGDAERLGLYGFGASAHIVAQVARHEGRRVFAFTRAGDEAAQSLRARARRRVGRRLGRAGARGARRGDPVRAGGRARPRGAAGVSEGRASSSAPGST